MTKMTSTQERLPSMQAPLPTDKSIIAGRILNKRLEIQIAPVLHVYQTEGKEAAYRQILNLMKYHDGRDVFCVVPVDDGFSTADRCLRDLGMKTHGHGHLPRKGDVLAYMSYRLVFDLLPRKDRFKSYSHS